MSRQRGFTLVEVLLAVLVFSLLAATVYTALNGLAGAASQQRDHARDLGELQLAVARLDQDLRQLVNRPVTTGAGPVPALVGEPGRLIGTRAGWGNPGDLPRSQLQRFGWSADNDSLIRDHWVVTDAIDVQPSVQAVIMLQVNSLAFRYRDGTGSWHDRWPVAGGQGLPAAIEVELDSPRFGSIRRLVVLD